MATLSSASAVPVKGIAELTSLGRTKKKGLFFPKTSIGKQAGEQKIGDNEGAQFIAIHDVRNPVDLNISLRPSPDLPANAPCPHKLKPHESHTFGKTEKRSQARQTIPTICEEEPMDTFVTSASSHNASHPSKTTNEVPSDFSLRLNLITESIRFEVFLSKSSPDVDVRTKALLIFAKFANLDP